MWQSRLVDDGLEMAGNGRTVMVAEAPKAAKDEPVVEGEEFEAAEAR